MHWAIAWLSNNLQLYWFHKFLWKYRPYMLRKVQINTYVILKPAETEFSKKKLWPDEKLHVFLTEVDFRIKLKNGSYHFPDRRFYLMTFKYSTNHSKTFQKSFTIIITKKEGIFEVHSKKNSQTNTTEKSSINSNVLTIKCYSNPEVGFPSTKFNNKIRKILKIKNWV